jgi:hypothetical protein
MTQTKMAETENMVEIYVAEHSSKSYGVTNYCKPFLILLFFLSSSSFCFRSSILSFHERNLI